MRQQFARQLSKAGALWLAAIREIFDEAAYSRFLQRRQIPPSREAYAAYLQESAAARERRPRCC